jgi:hypothetical protein
MTGRRRRAPRTTNAFAEIRTRLIGEGGAITEKMVAIFLKERPEIDHDEAQEIHHVGLMRLASEVNSRARDDLTSPQPDLFEKFPAAPKSVVLRAPDETGAIQPVHRPIDLLTVREAKQYIAKHMTPRPLHSDEIEDFARMVTYLSKYGKADWTLAECWEAAQKAGKPRRHA